MLKQFTGFLAILFFLFQPSLSLSAQNSETAQPGPKGIYLSLGKNIPCGKPTLLYRIDRKVKGGAWMPMTELRFPATYAAFRAKLEKARAALPAQPLPTEPKLKALYSKAAESGKVDSLGKRIQIPVRLALGIMFYDSDVKNDNEYQYRVTEIQSAQNQAEPMISNTVSVPFTAKFDEIVLVETSRDDNSAFIRWRSAGNNPSPLFMVFRIEDKKPVAASGLTGHYTMNDTTYYTYRDTLGALATARELQYFLAPYDLLGNPGKQSQTAVITRDNFIKASFLKTSLTKLTERTGNRIAWHFSDPITSRSIEVYRSEKPDIGFRKVAGLTPADTVFNDEMILPEKGYYYYIQANSRNGNRFKQSDTFYTPPCMPVMPQAPVLKSAGTIPGGVKLLVEVSEVHIGGVRIFRNDGISPSLMAVSELIPINAAAPVTYVDSSSSLSGRRNYTYAVRAESTGNVVSELSNMLTARPGLSSLPPAPSYMKAFCEGTKVKLYWEDMRQADTGIAGYIVLRRNETAGRVPALPFMKIAGLSLPYPANAFTDSTAKAGNIYTYAVQPVDISKIPGTQKSMLTVSLLKENPVAPFGLSAKNIREGILLEWIQLSCPGMQSFKLYRQLPGQAASLLSTLPATATAYTDTTVQGGQQYQYFITTLNSSGKESENSDKAVVLSEK